MCAIYSRLGKTCLNNMGLESFVYEDLAVLEWLMKPDILRLRKENRYTE